jgi:hypothetical protein
MIIGNPSSIDNKKSRRSIGKNPTSGSLRFSLRHGVYLRSVAARPARSATSRAGSAS